MIMIWLYLLGDRTNYSLDKKMNMIYLDMSIFDFFQLIYIYCRLIKLSEL